MPVALDNEREYRLAEQDVIAWLREQPLDLSRARPQGRGRAARRAARAAQRAASGWPRAASSARRWPGSRTSSPPTSRSSSSPATARSRSWLRRALPGRRCTCSAATPPRRARPRCTRSRSRRPAADRLLDARGRCPVHAADGHRPAIGAELDRPDRLLRSDRCPGTPHGRGVVHLHDAGFEKGGDPAHCPVRDEIPVRVGREAQWLADGIAGAIPHTHGVERPIRHQPVFVDRIQALHIVVVHPQRLPDGPSRGGVPPPHGLVPAARADEATIVEVAGPSHVVVAGHGLPTGVPQPDAVLVGRTPDTRHLGGRPRPLPETRARVTRRSRGHPSPRPTTEWSCRSWRWRCGCRRG